jgi:peptidoglycan hydrolase CwlO-like protein
MNKDKLKEKLKKVENSLQPLLEKRKGIDEKIKAKQAEISALKSQISEADFKELQSQLSETGLSLDELKKAIETQDFSILKVGSEQTNQDKS